MLVLLGWPRLLLWVVYERETLLCELRDLCLGERERLAELTQRFIREQSSIHRFPQGIWLRFEFRELYVIRLYLGCAPEMVAEHRAPAYTWEKCGVL